MFFFVLLSLLQILCMRNLESKLCECMIVSMAQTICLHEAQDFYDPVHHVAFRLIMTPFMQYDSLRENAPKNAFQCT